MSHDILAGVEWTENVWETPPEGDIPYATHSGELVIGDIRLRCHQLSNGQRIIDADDLERLFSCGGDQ